MTAVAKWMNMPNKQSDLEQTSYFSNAIFSVSLIDSLCVNQTWLYRMGDHHLMPWASDVNKDMGPKAKDRGHKAKTKAKAFKYQGQG